MCMIALMKDGCTEDSEIMCTVALLKDAPLRQGDDVRGCTDERCSTETAR